MELVATFCSLFGSIPPVFRRPAQKTSVMQQSYVVKDDVTTPWSTPATQRPVVNRRKQVINELNPLIQYELRKVYRKIREEIDSQHRSKVELENGSATIKAGITANADYERRLEEAIVQNKESETTLEAWLAEQSVCFFVNRL